jgi:hypothetical protein
MTPEEKAALHAAMYQPEEETEETSDPQPLTKAWFDKQNLDKNFEIENSGKFVTIQVYGKRITLPSVSYVSSLEKIILSQAKEILRLKASNAQIRNLVNQHSTELNDVNKELDKKLNMRDRL